jgi:D-alanyl-lipoteichoic acid acyltransferase DltB (MBOAT superfamily)
MLFNSFGFLAFFAALVPTYYLTPHRYRWPLLVAASLFFYATFRIEYLGLLFAVSAVAYGAGLFIARPTDEGRPKEVRLKADTTRRRAVLGASVAAIVGVLAVAKVVPQAGLAGAAGLSFYSLSAISYLVDLHRGELAAERHFGRLLLYLAFFPKLLAGPLERAGPFLEQLATPVAFSGSRVVSGLQLVLWGLFKKVVIADRLAVFVDAAYRQPTFAPPADLVIATYFFAFQLYCDFSGYSDMAIGTARVLGIDLMENFRRPYLSASVAEFWSRRWHVSLASWFRDYVYIPLGGSRTSRVRHALNLMAVFVLSGAWHGANWTFVVWGGLNGLYVVASTALSRRGTAVGRRSAGVRMLGTVGTFHAVLITWVFFRAASLADAASILERTARAVPVLPRLLWVRVQDPAVLLAVATIVVLVGVELVDERRPMWERLRARPLVLRWAVYYALLAALVVLGTWNLRQFVYMQF